MGLRVEVEEFLDGGTQVGIAGTLLVQERAALRRIQVGGLLEQRLDGFGRWLGHSLGSASGVYGCLSAPSS